MYTGLGVKSFWEYHMQSLNQLDSGFQVLLKAQRRSTSRESQQHSGMWPAGSLYHIEMGI